MDRNGYETGRIVRVGHMEFQIQIKRVKVRVANRKVMETEQGSLEKKMG